jgi:hypothetical protein
MTHGISSVFTDGEWRVSANFERGRARRFPAVQNSFFTLGSYCCRGFGGGLGITQVVVANQDKFVHCGVKKLGQ